MRIRRTPQEKKRLSYERDRRNVYGENDKSSRKKIPLNKALTKRAHRSNVRAAISGADFNDPDELDSRVRAIKRKPWKKIPDEPLRAVLQQKSERRRRREGRKARSRNRPAVY